jgi:hypothetical protein
MAISNELRNIIEAQPDILQMDSIQVTSGMNGNDDVFLKDELWKARKTPFLKPVNWEHESGKENSEANSKAPILNNQIIGATYNCYAMYSSGTIIPDDVSELPSKFHLVTQDVIWKYNFPKTAARIEEGAKAGTLFVSMEAWFNDYDYLVGDKIVARNEETAFLDNYLRAYGGTGKYSEKQVGRVLRNIVFGGKGIVKRPANKESVILSVGEIKTEELEKMSASAVKVEATPTIVDVEPLHKEIAELKKSLENRDKNLENIKSALVSTVDKVAASLGERGNGLKKAVADIYADWSVTLRGYEFLDLTNYSSAVTELFSNILKEREDAMAKLSTSEAALAKIAAEKLLADRLNKVEAALGAEVKTKSAESVAKMSDEQFNVWFDSLVTIKASLTPAPAPVKEPVKTEASEIDETEVLESVKAETPVPAGKEVTSPELDITTNMKHLVAQMLGDVKEGK